MTSRARKYIVEMDKRNAKRNTGSAIPDWIEPPTEEDYKVNSDRDTSKAAYLDRRDRQNGR